MSGLVDMATILKEKDEAEQERARKEEFLSKFMLRFRGVISRRLFVEIENVLNKSKKLNEDIEDKE